MMLIAVTGSSLTSEGIHMFLTREGDGKAAIRAFCNYGHLNMLSLESSAQERCITIQAWNQVAQYGRMTGHSTPEVESCIRRIMSENSNKRRNIRRLKRRRRRIRNYYYHSTQEYHFFSNTSDRLNRIGRPAVSCQLWLMMHLIKHSGNSWKSGLRPDVSPAQILKMLRSAGKYSDITKISGLR